MPRVIEQSLFLFFYFSILSSDRRSAAVLVELRPRLPLHLLEEAAVEVARLKPFQLCG